MQKCQKLVIENEKLRKHLKNLKACIEAEEISSQKAQKTLVKDLQEGVLKKTITETMTEVSGSSQDKRSKLQLTKFEKVAAS